MFKTPISKHDLPRDARAQRFGHLNFRICFEIRDLNFGFTLPSVCGRTSAASLVSVLPVPAPRILLPWRGLPHALALRASLFSPASALPRPLFVWLSFLRPVFPPPLSLRRSTR